MGDPKKLKKKYKTPNHPWNLKNIEENRLLTKEFGLRIRKEILIADSFLKKYKNIAKSLIANSTTQGKKEEGQILEKLTNLGLVPAGGDLNAILGLEVKDILNRRLQSVVYRQGLCRSMKQARQFIVHRHIRIGDKEMTIPSYLVSLQEESAVAFKDKSSLSDEDHPERKQDVVAEEVAKVEEKKEEPVVEEKKEKVAPVKVKDETKTKESTPVKEDTTSVEEKAEPMKDQEDNKQ